METSNLYKELLASDHSVETRLVIGSGKGLLIDENGNFITFGGTRILIWVGTPEDGFDGSMLFSMETTGALFSGNTLCVGGTVAGEIDVTMRMPAGTIPRQARLAPFSRLTDGVRHSEWIPCGVYYVDTRKLIPGKVPKLRLHGFDAMLKAEQSYPTSKLNWPARDMDVVKEIAAFIGVELHPDTLRSIRNGYPIQYPGDFTCRETLGYIAAMYGGNFVMSSEGTLRYLSSRGTGSTDLRDLGSQVRSLENAPAFAPISKVVVQTGETSGWESGDDSGRTLEVFTPWGSQNVADDLLRTLREGGWQYRPFAAQGAVLDPAVELGDSVILNGETLTICDRRTRFGVRPRSDISAPHEEEIDHEYPYTPPQERKVNRKLGQISSTLLVHGDQIQAQIQAQKVLEGEVENAVTLFVLTNGKVESEVSRALGEERRLGSKITQTAESIDLKVSKGDVSSQISMESGAVNIHSNRMTIDSTNFKLNGSGEVSATGSIKTLLGPLGTIIDQGQISLIAGNSTALILSGKEVDGGMLYPLPVCEMGVYEQAFTIMDGHGSDAAILFNNGLNPYGCTDRMIVRGDSHFNGQVNITDCINFVSRNSGATVYSRIEGLENGIELSKGLWVWQDFVCYGTKHRAVETEHFGCVGMNAMESTCAVFSDLGSAVLDDTGAAWVFMSLKFLETVDSNCEYQVFITQTNDKGISYVEKHRDYFIVHGEPGATADWIVYARQRDYQLDYMENVDEKRAYVDDPFADESVFYRDNAAASAAEDYMKNFDVDYDALADIYMNQYEQEVTDL